MSKEHVSSFWGLSEFNEKSSEEKYLRNLLLLGRMAAKYGQPKPNFPIDGNVSWTFAESTSDSRQGFEIDLCFLSRLDPAWNQPNHDYPYLVLSKRGEGTGLFGQATAQRIITIVLKADSLTILKVFNNPKSKAEYEKALTFDDPEELQIGRSGRRLQMKSIYDSFVSYSAYPSAISTQPKAMILKVTNEAIAEFSGLPRLDEGNISEVK